MSIQGAVNKALGTAGAYSAIKNRLEDADKEKQTLAKKPKHTLSLTKESISREDLITKMKLANERAKERKEAKQHQARNYSANLVYGGVENGKE